MINNKRHFYAVGNFEYIDAESIDEAVQDWYDGLSDPRDFQEEVEVDCFTFMEIGEKYWAGRLEDIVESLDEAYGCEETYGDYTPSDKAKELWEAFTKQVTSEYQVAELRLVSTQKVKVRDYIQVLLEDEEN